MTVRQLLIQTTVCLLPATAAFAQGAQTPQTMQGAPTPRIMQGAQVKEGKITFERKINIHKRLTDESMKAMVPEFNVSKTELFFSGDESLYRNIKEEEDIRDQAGKGDGPMINMKFSSADAQTYKNYATDRSAELTELGPKKYIIDDTMRKYSWKLESDTQSIKGYLCHKATTKDQRGNPVVAWYAESLLAPAGPESFGGLPGVILLANINDGELTLTALEIKAGNLDKAIVKAPTNGKKITRAEYKKMQEEAFGPDAGNGKAHITIIRQ